VCFVYDVSLQESDSLRVDGVGLLKACTREVPETQ